MAKYKQYRGRPRRGRGQEHYVNQYIKAPKVRLIDEDGQNLGVVATEEALKKAKTKELDLVVIAEKADPPVAKILEYSKFLYEERKKHASSRAKSAKSETKEFIFGPNIGEGDLHNRIDRTIEFLNEGNRVKMSVKLRGREMAHPEIGMAKIETVIKELTNIAKVEEEPKLKGNLITAVFVKK